MRNHSAAIRGRVHGCQKPLRWRWGGSLARGGLSISLARPGQEVSRFRSFRRAPLWALLIVAAALPASAQTCVFSINPTSASFPAAGGNDIIDITLTSGPGTCQRTAVANSNWITVSFGTPGTGNGAVGYTVQSNPFAVERSGTITVAGRTFTVNQAAGACTYSISPSSVNLSAAGATGSFNLTASMNSCPWTAASSSDWLLLSSAASGTGSATVRYTATANPATASRNGTIAVAGQTFTAAQAGVCSFTLNPATASIAAAGATGSIAVAASASSCAWTALSSNDWLTLTGAASGTGNGTVTYSATANTTLQDRVGSIAIGNTGFTVFQPGASCALTFSANGKSFPVEGGSGSFYVTGACPWSAGADSPWIAASGVSTTGSGTVNYIVAGNTDTASRTGSINVGSRSYSVQQAGVPCSVSIGATTASAPATAASGSFHVSAGSGCNWVASTVSSWVKLSNAAGAGEGDVAYLVEANIAPQPRTAVVSVANRQLTIVQDAADCDFQLTPAQATYTAAGGSGTIYVGATCSWTASTAASWIALTSSASGTGQGAVGYMVAANPTADARSGSLRIAGHSVTIQQSGKDCSVTVSPASVQLSGRGSSAVISIKGSKGCRWEPRADSEWIAIPSWSAVDGTGAVTVSAAANPNAAVRFGAVNVAGMGVAVIQGGLEVLLVRNGVVNAASFAAGPVAPGEIVTLFGSGMGPVEPVKLNLTSDGQRITGMVAQTQVWFDDVPAPLLYVSDLQLSAVVPYSVTGNATTELRVSNQGVFSDPVRVPVAPANPAIFTVDASGRGPGAILNQDNTTNSAANAAARNSIIQIFATGEGQTDPPGEDGRIAGATPLPKPRQAVTVSIGGQTLQPVYAGAAPGAVAGLMQVNVRIPPNAPVGAAIPIVLRVGPAASPAGVTLAIR